ncbi:MAG: histidine kinase [Cyclobacteriaceae bacterium]
MLILLANTSLAEGQTPLQQYKKNLAESETALDSIDNIVAMVDLYIERNVDSAHYYLEITRELTKRENDTIGLSTYYLLLSKVNKGQAKNDLAIAHLLKAESLAKSVDYQWGLDLIWVDLGYFYRRTGKLDSSNYYLRKVYENSKNLDDRLSALNGISLNYKSVGAYDKALEGFYEILEATAPDNHRDFATIYSNIALVTLGQGDDDKATDIFRKALNEARQTDNVRAIGYAEKMLGNRYRQANSYDSSLYLLNSARQKFARVNAIFEEASASINLGLTYTDMKNWDKAKAEFRNAGKILENKNLAFTESFYLKSLARFQYDNPAIPAKEAIKTLDSAEEMAMSNNMTDELKSIYDMKSKFLEDTDPALALSYFRKFHHISDSINTLKNRNYSAMLETRFETAKKDQAIKNLEQEKAINMLQLKQQKTAISASVGILVLLAIGTLLFFRQRKLKHQHVVENMQHRLLRIQMNPHFIFNALMSIQNFMMKNKPAEAGIYLSRFAKLMRQTLELSREETIDLLEEKEMLENYIEIQQLRADNKFDYEINIEDSLIEKDVKIPPMYAQPFVENAIEHGQLGEIENGKLSIYFRENNDKMEVVIEDNGAGISEYKVKSSHNSLSTIITRERLDILEKRFKSQFGISINNRIEAIKNSGTQVRILLPMLSE